MEAKKKADSAPANGCVPGDRLVGLVEGPDLDMSKRQIPGKSFAEGKLYLMRYYTTFLYVDSSSFLWQLKIRLQVSPLMMKNATSWIEQAYG